MGTTGSVDINLSALSGQVNATTDIVNQVVTGVADQGALIGLAIGLIIAIGLLIGLVIFMLNKLTQVLSKTKGIGGRF